MHVSDVPGEDKNGESPDFNDDYEDDFIATRYCAVIFLNPITD